MGMSHTTYITYASTSPRRFSSISDKRRGVKGGGGKGEFSRCRRSGHCVLGASRCLFAAVWGDAFKMGFSLKENGGDARRFGWKIGWKIGVLVLCFSALWCLAGWRVRMGIEIKQRVVLVRLLDLLKVIAY